MLVLLAQANDPGRLPSEKAVAMIVFFGAVALISLIVLFAPKKLLVSMAGIIGTKNPMVARAVCGFGLLVGAGITFAAVMSLLGKL
jgi:hypothetical protein